MDMDVRWKQRFSNFKKAVAQLTDDEGKAIEADIQYIIGNINRFEEVEKAIIFGSRARGNYKPGSDVDIAIFGDHITFDTISALHSALEEQSPFPYYFDIADYTHLKHPELKEHIDRIEKLIYERVSGT